MARKRTKGAQAQISDSSATTQTQRLDSAQLRAHQQSKPKSKPGSKPGATSSSVAKTDKNRKTKANISDTRTLELPENPPKAISKPNKATIVSGGQPGSSKKKNNPDMARSRNKNKRPTPASSAQTAKLELPEGLERPKEQAQKKKHNRSRKTNQHSDKKPVDNEPGPVVPWDLDNTYPQPLGRPCTFDYHREWVSLRGKNVKEEMQKALQNARDRKLRRSSILTKEEQKELHDKYWQEGKASLHKAILANTTTRGSYGHFIASLKVDATQIEPVDSVPGLVGILQVNELRKMILNMISPSIRDLTALAMTCKEVAFCMRESFDVWDMRLTDFPTDEFAEKRDTNGRLLQRGGIRSNILIVSPLSDEDQEQPYTADFTSLVHLCHAMARIPLSFRTLVLDQIPFLSVALFEMMVNTMPNLEAVTITRCQMLDVTKLQPLLEVIKRHPRVPSPNGSKSLAQDESQPASQDDSQPASEDDEDESQPAPQDYIQLDFAPYFFEGPTSGDVKRLGSYGVTYNEPIFHTPMAVFCIIMRCWKLSKTVGMDLLGDGSSFWRFVCRLPGPDVLWAMKAREAWIAYDHGVRAGCPKAVVKLHCADDLTAALVGDNQPHTTRVPWGMQVDSHLWRHDKYWRLWHKCPMCKFVYPLSLFPLRADSCWGCKMDQFVYGMEDSHLRLWQDTTIRLWLSGTNPQSSGLRPLLSRQNRLNKVLDEVSCIDWTRKYFLNGPKTIPLDAEEQQWTVSPSASKNKKQKTNRSVSPSASKNKNKKQKTNWSVSPSASKKAQKEIQWGSPVDVSEPTEQKPQKPQKPQPFCPQPPKILGKCRASLARWRWYHSPADTGFDYRQGGPQRVNPCKEPLSATAEQEVEGTFDAERKANFEERWEWTSASDEAFDKYWQKYGEVQHPKLYHSDLSETQLRARAREDGQLRKEVRDEERWEQNKYDKEVHKNHHAHVQDCLYSISTVGMVPLNLDEPLPDPVLNPEGYWKLVDLYKWKSGKYNHERCM